MKTRRLLTVLALTAASALSCAAVLDEGEWPNVTPQFTTPPVRTAKGTYFAGKMIKSEMDQRGTITNRFLLRRDFTLKGNPAEAKVQFAADDGAVLKINGKSAARNSTWDKPTVADVARFLRAGANTMDFDYHNGFSAGGVLAELFVRYEDGSFERIDTDSSFRSSIDGGKTWKGVVVQAPPPAKPWKYVRRLKYLDFLHRQTFAGGTVLTGDPQSGKGMSARFSFAGLPPELPLVFEAKIVRDGGCFWAEEKTVGAESVKAGEGGSWTLDVDFDLPLYLSEGKYELLVESGGFFCADGAKASVPFSCRRAELPGFAKAPVAEVRDVAGAPQIFVDGKPVFGLWGGVAQLARPDRLPRHSSAPLTLVTVYAPCGEWWPRTDAFDPSVLDRQAELFRRENGDGAYFIWDVTIYPPQDWIDSHPDEMCRDDAGNLVRDGRATYSLTSVAALDAMEKALVKVISYLERSPYANRIIGYRVNSGHTIEWLGWDPPPGRMLDFSPAAQKAFERYLRERHPDWNDTKTPTAAERVSSDPAARAKTAAYYDFYSRSVADDVIRLTRRAKGLVGGKKLVGTYYGYVMTMHATGRSQMRAHYALKHLLKAGSVDFLMSPQAYGIRRLGDTCGDMKPFATLGANGVVPVIEDDTRDSNGPYNGNNWQTFTRAQDIGVIRRNACIALCRREPVYFYALCEGTEFDFPEFAADMSLVRKVGEWCLARKAGRHAGVAYVVSEEAIKNQPFPKSSAKPTGLETQRYLADGTVKKGGVGAILGYGDSFQLNYTSLARAGAPVDYVLAEDLADHPGDYALYIAPDLPSGKMRFRTASGEAEADTLLRPDKLREAYRKAGVHVFCDSDDPMEANDCLFTLHARSVGRKTVRLPRKTTVLDVFNRRVVAKGVDTFSFDAALHSTHLFYFADDAEALAAELSPWSGSEWIRAVSGDGGDSSVFEKRFVNPKPVSRARWTVTGLGVFEASVNGREVGDFLKPGYTHIGKCRHSFSYDVTSSMKLGKGDENVLSATVSGGWWRDWIVSNGRRDMLPCDDQSGPDGRNPNSPESSAESAFRAVLELEYADGTRETIGTDPSWLAAKGGPVRKANIYDGETYDARATNVVWGKAERYDYFRGEIRPLVGPPVRLREDLALAPLSICAVQGAANETEDAYGVARIVRGYADGDVVEVVPGETLVVDFGQNCAAVPRFDLEGPEGAVMTVRMSEMLNEGGGLKSRGNDGPDGTPYLAALRGIFAGVKYTFREGRQRYQPTHSFFGYRYAGITATRPIRIRSMRSVPVTSISKEAEAGFIETGDKAVNKLISNIRWGHYSNYLSVPTDCPQRNERLGWTGDTQVFCPAAMYNADVLGFLRKWLADCRDTQLEDGSYLSVAPPGAAGRGGPMSGWADAGIVVPYRLWRNYGDTRVIEEGWDSMVRYMDRIESTDGPDAHRVGDHLSYELNDINVKRYLSACYYVSDSAQMAQMAAATGRHSEKARFLEMERKARRLFSERFLDSSGEIKEECRCQTTALYALSLDLVSGKARERTREYLVANIRSHGNRLQTGFLGTGIMMDTLSKEGLTELAYTLLLQHDEPSWLYSVDQGATTIWERWNGYTKAKGFGPASMNSFNHYAYGAVLSWLYSVPAGIRLHESVNAYRRFVLAPEPDRRLGSVRARYRSASGTIESAWEYAPDGNWRWRFTVPDGTEAEVRLGWAGRKPEVFGPGVHEIAVERDVIYALGSLTKPFTAALALTYVDEGRIGLDDKVGDLLPAVTNGCTLRQLLSCTAGYSLRHSMYPLDRIPVSNLVEELSGPMCETAPGTVYNYGPWGFYIAAALVERLSGKPFEAAMEERILRPLGMKDATFYPTQSQTDRIDASALGLMYFTYPLTDSRRRAVPDFGLFASDGDLRKFGEMLLAGGVSAGGRRVLSEKSAGEFFRKQTPGGVGRNYSFGFNVDESAGQIWCSSATRVHMSVSRSLSKVEVVPPPGR